MKINECIVLAGGLGTRLRSVVENLPKCMAPVNGKPYIVYVIEHFKHQGINKFIFSLGYKHEIITEYLENYLQLSIHDSRFTIYDSPLSFHYSTEPSPLGTGGAIRFGCEKVSEKNVLVINGDTLFRINLDRLVGFHAMHGADCTLSLKPMKNFDRYGIVELNNDYSIKSFKEKQFYQEGFINGGVYILNAENFSKEQLPEKFSFEKDYLEKFYDKRRMCGVVQDEYFIDIGIPEDYARAQVEL